MSSALERIALDDHSVGAFVDVFFEEALEAARVADRRLVLGGSGALLGLPIAVKDDLDVAGHPTRRGLAGPAPPATHDDPAVAALRRAGAIIVGKTAMSEAALWATTTSATNAPTRNPAASGRSPGGSSGGSAAAVAAGMVAGALGTDMGGSVRIPAACCGVVGMKPERSAASMTAADQRWRGLRSVGPMARTVEDCVLLQRCLHGPAEAPLEIAGVLRVAFSTAAPRPDVQVDGRISVAVRHAADLLKRAGHVVAEADPPFGAILAASLPRYLRAAADELATSDDAALERRTREAKHAAARVPAKLAAVSERLERPSARRLHAFFSDWDVLLCPATAHQPPAETAWSGLSALAALRRQVSFAHTAPVWNVTGQPAITVPIATAADSAPIGVQLVGAPGRTDALLELAGQLERARDASPKDRGVAHV